MDNYEITFDEELQHWGIKGQKWGVRRYQNKDGSLTEAGQKRYNKEMDKLNKEKVKLEAKREAARIRKENQAKVDELEAAKQKLKDENKAIKDELKGKKTSDDSDKPEETLEEKRERILKSTDPKEVYADRHVLTDAELNQKVNRINTEINLSNKIVEEQAKTGLEIVNEKMKKASDTINNATTLYKKVDDAYKTVTESAIGKALTKTLGLEVEEKVKEFDLDDFYNNMHKMSTKEREAGVKIVKDMQTTKLFKDKIDKEREEAAKVAEEAKAEQEYKDYNEAIRKSWETPVNDTSSTYRQKGKDVVDDILYTRNHTPLLLPGPTLDDKKK